MKNALIALAVTTFLLVASVGVGLVLFVVSVRGGIQESQIGACDRGNVVRADRIIDSRDPDDSEAERKRVNSIFPILDCPTTVKSQEAVVVPEPARSEFIDAVEDLKTPIIRDQVVVYGAGD